MYVSVDCVCHTSVETAKVQLAVFGHSDSMDAHCFLPSAGCF